MSADLESVKQPTTEGELYDRLKLAKRECEVLATVVYDPGAEKALGEAALSLDLATRFWLHAG